MSWPLVKIGDCCSTGSGGTPSRTNAEYFNGHIPWIKSGDLRENVVTAATEFISDEAVKKSSAKLVPQGAILLAMYGATVGRMALLGIDAATNQAVCNIVPDSTRAFTKYVYYALLHKVPDFLASAVGGAQPNISQGIIKDTLIPLPPLPEQKRIAAILDKADTIRRKRQQAIKLADDFLRSVFLEMFGDPVTNPKGWEPCRFEDLTDMVTYGLTVRPEYIDEGIPLISAKEIRSGAINLEICSRISEADLNALSSKARPNYGDILFSKTGSIGHCALVDTEEPFAITQNAARIVPNTKRCESHFLLGLLRTKYFYNLANKEAKGNAVKDLQLGVMKAFPVYAPPLELQRKYSEILQKFTGQNLLQEEALKRAEEGFNSLSQKAFLGSL